jgi:hypothetical protein
MLPKKSAEISMASLTHEPIHRTGDTRHWTRDKYKEQGTRDNEHWTVDNGQHNGQQTTDNGHEH